MNVCGNREAAKYRRQLRAAESERDALRERIKGYQRAEVERRISDRLAAPADLWLTGVRLADVLNASGELGAEKLDHVVRDVCEAHPTTWRAMRGVDDDQGRKTDPPMTTPTWAGLLRDGTRE